MPLYEPETWVDDDGSETVGTVFNAERMNKIEDFLAILSVDIKDSVRVCTTENITISTGLNNGDKVDGVTLETGDRVLVANQSTLSQNGIYVVGASPVRASDADEVGELSGGTMTYVEQGNVYGGRLMRIVTPGAVTPGSTNHSWTPLNPKNFGRVESLPSNPLADDECYFIADKTNGIIWHLVYDGEGTYPWKKIGGPPLRDSDNSAPSTTSTTYVSLTGPLTLTAPLSGHYDIRIEGQLYSSATASETASLSYAVGATSASDNWRITSFNGPAGGQTTSPSLATEHTVAKGDSITEKAKTAAGNACYFSNRRLWIDPIRVG